MRNKLGTLRIGGLGTVDPNYKFAYIVFFSIIVLGSLVPAWGNSSVIVDNSLDWSNATYENDNTIIQSDGLILDNEDSGLWSSHYYSFSDPVNLDYFRLVSSQGVNDNLELSLYYNKTSNYDSGINVKESFPIENGEDILTDLEGDFISFYIEFSLESSDNSIFVDSFDFRTSDAENEYKPDSAVDKLLYLMEESHIIFGVFLIMFLVVGFLLWA